MAFFSPNTHALSFVLKEKGAPRYLLDAFVGRIHPVEGATADDVIWTFLDLIATTQTAGVWNTSAGHAWLKFHKTTQAFHHPVGRLDPGAFVLTATAHVPRTPSITVSFDHAHFWADTTPFPRSCLRSTPWGLSTVPNHHPAIHSFLAEEPMLGPILIGLWDALMEHNGPEGLRDKFCVLGMHAVHLFQDKTGWYHTYHDAYERISRLANHLLDGWLVRPNAMPRCTRYVATPAYTALLATLSFKRAFAAGRSLHTLADGIPLTGTMLQKAVEPIRPPHPPSAHERMLLVGGNQRIGKAVFDALQQAHMPIQRTSAPFVA